jgi:hypothetical protein
MISLLNFSVQNKIINTHTQIYMYEYAVHAVEKWSKHYATSRKVAGSEPVEVNDSFFNLPNPSVLTKPWVSLSI